MSCPSYAGGPAQASRLIARPTLWLHLRLLHRTIATGAAVCFGAVAATLPSLLLPAPRSATGKTAEGSIPNRRHRRHEPPAILPHDWSMGGPVPIPSARNPTGRLTPARMRPRRASQGDCPPAGSPSGADRACRSVPGSAPLPATSDSRGGGDAATRASGDHDGSGCPSCGPRNARSGS
jgi:hypothetical protein